MFAPLILTVTLAGSGVKEVAGNMFHLILRADGTVYGLGSDKTGMIPRDPWAEGIATRPLKLDIPGKVRQIAAGDTTGYALLEDGTVVSWGANDRGQLGVGAENPNPGSPPKPIAGLTGITQISAASHHALALRRDGRVFAWGESGQGLLGRGLQGAVSTPREIEGLKSIVQISTGYRHSLALAKDGTVWAWGANGNGELGLGSRTPFRDVPTKVPGLSQVASVAAGPGSFGYSAAIQANGTVWAWGSNQVAMIGNGKRAGSGNEPGAAFPKPVQVRGISGAKQISIGTGQVVVRLANGGIVLWGHDGWGQLGVGTSGGYHETPVKAKGFGNVAGVFACGNRTFAIKSDGSLWWAGTSIGSRRGPFSKDVHVFTKVEMP